MEIFDISVPLSRDVPIWPGSVGFALSRVSSIEAGDPATVSRLDCDVHTGTHIDAPAHFVLGGSLVEDVALTDMVGPCLVVGLPAVETIDAQQLERLSLPADTRRLLFHTRNSELWARKVSEFRRDYVALTADAARWIVDREIALVGIDYLSIQRYGDEPTTHEILLEDGVVILEGLNLSRVPAGSYFLVCLPLRLGNAEAAPARAVLLRSGLLPAHQ
jgi:arylformamidase